ncbi:hypothetical protein KAI87_07880, partial [Myxococcota bacterium]|nr:hypothetical protein [Myxococcota bacterium]
IHTYPEATTFFFTQDSETGESRDQSLPTRFNDGAKAQVSGSVRVIFPADCEGLTQLHRKFKSSRGVIAKLVLPAIRRSLFSSGPHMSAAESYAERRAEFADLVEDQLINGTIKVEKHAEKRLDPITGDEQEAWVIEKSKCETESLTCVGGYVRMPSAFAEFGIRVTNFVIDAITYSPEVLQQIERQRKARMDIITQEAEARQAEARAAKAGSEAQALIAETRAHEEVAKTERVVKAEADKAEAILHAEKKKDVAVLDLESAGLEKKANILRGEGEAAKRRLIMQADGALSLKLEAWLKAQEAYASALAKAQPGALVPSVVMGGGSGGGNSSAQQWMEVMMMKAARDLSLDMKMKQ